MTVTPETTRTPEPDDGDAAEQTPTTDPQAEDERTAPAPDDLTKLREELLRAKVKAERHNEIEEENRRLRAQLEPPPVAPESEDDEADPIEAGVKYHAGKGDPVALKLNRVEKRLNEREKELEKRETQLLKAIADAHQIEGMGSAEQQLVLNHYKSNRGTFKDPNEAREDLMKQIDTLNRERQRQKPAQTDVKDVPPTHGREVPAKEHKARTMSRDEWNDELKRLEATDYRQKLAKIREMKEGKIVIRG